MAEQDFKKDFKKNSGKDFKKSDSKGDPAIERLFEVIIVLVLLYLLYQNFLASFSFTLFLSRAESFFFSISGTVREVFLGLSTIAIFLTIFFFVKWRDISSAEYRAYKARSPLKKAALTRGIEWVSVIDNVNSDNEAQWRVAILEADRILEKVLTANGFIGETVAEQLKSIPQGRYSYLNSAWEAHKIRNVIAHEGLKFNLTSREASRVISLYEYFFREIGYL